MAMEAEIDLWRAVLEQAISDSIKLLEKGERRPKLWNDYLFRMDVRHLRRWFLNSSREPGSFRFICEVLDIDHEQALAQIQEQFLQHMVLPRWKPQPKEEEKEK
uniref:Uncharacterized protein n=1 Tax=Magnetococcus massalia (strain MO-1) TaxID=451514 RepID=A0A1S7LIY1_MAGMO|nr:Protein of unknown function [Candidatus Magnetococcus massalia]